MSYFVVERSSDGGGLRIPLPTAYETREAAIAALSAATASGEVRLAGEVFIADLGNAVPVLVMAAAAPVAPVELPAVEAAPEVPEDHVEAADEALEPVEAAIAVEPEAEEAAAEVAGMESGDFMIEQDEPEPEPVALDEESADEVYTSWAPIVDVPAEGSSLADALKRAATTLEDEGVVAPDSVLAASGIDDVEGGEPSGADESLREPPVVEVHDDETGSEWPWSNVESYEVPAESADPANVVIDEDVEPASVVSEPASVVAEPASVVAEDTDIAALVESLGEDAPIITSAPPEGEEVYVPHPVILGDYGDTSEAEVLLGEAVVDPDDEMAESETDEVPGVAEADDEALLDGAGDALGDLPEVLPDSGYAPSGELDLGEYTCQDCVYSNTCPKVGEVTPAECGSFQWKSE